MHLAETFLKFFFTIPLSEQSHNLAKRFIIKVKNIPRAFSRRVASPPFSRSSPCRSFRLRKKRKRENVGNESITSRLSFGSSDIQATYYARFLTPQIARISFFFSFFFHLCVRPLCPFSSLPQSCSHLAVLFAVSYSVCLYVAQLQKRNFNWSKKSPSHSLFFLYSRLYLGPNRGFSSKGVTRLHERRKKFPRSENLPVFHVS